MADALCAALCVICVWDWQLTDSFQLTWFTNPTMHQFQEKCAHFGSKWWYGTGALWNLWDWSHDRHSVSNHQQLGCWFNGLFRLISKETSKIRITGPLEIHPRLVDSSQRASNAESASISWRQHRPINSAISVLQLIKNIMNILCFIHNKGHPVV